WFWVLIGCAVADLAIFACLALMPEPLLFMALTGGLGFAWLFASPFLVPMTIEADPTRRAALLIGGAQLVGGSLGPLFASFLVTAAGAGGALVWGGAWVVAAGAVVLGLHATRSR